MPRYKCGDVVRGNGPYGDILLHFILGYDDRGRLWEFNFTEDTIRDTCRTDSIGLGGAPHGWENPEFTDPLPDEEIHW